jgi:ubiquinone biosynthesis protein
MERIMPISHIMKNFLRVEEILTVFLRHGFGDLVQRLGLSQYLKSSPAEEQGSVRKEREVQSTARRFREALEELGGAFVKLGQLLSTRPDILPANWIEELVRLQDNVPPVDFDPVLQTLEEELGPISERFQHVDPVPLATASVAQVHAGVTREGDKIVIKVRKPGIKRTILRDYDILEALAELLEKHVPETRIYRPVQMVAEFRFAVNEELDFTLEGQNLDRFRADFESDPAVMFPAVYWEYTTERVLTMEHVEGIKISLLDSLREQGINTATIAHQLAEAILRQTLEFGFFHGDPHPGNILIVGNDRICFLDCGMVGRLGDPLKENLVFLVSAGIRKDTAVIADILTEMSALPEDIDRPRFVKEADLILERYYRLPLKRIRLDYLITDLIRLIHKFRIQIPSEMVLVGKAIVTIEGVGRALDPDFQAIAVAEPYIRQIVMTTYWPRFLKRRLIEGSHDILRLLRDLPSDLRELSRHMRENRFRVVVDHTGLNEPVKELERASRRLSASMVISATVLASAIMVHANLEPHFFGVPVIGLAGFAVSGLIALGLLISSRRKNSS